MGRVDLLDKTRGTVGCSHCQGLGARQTCPMCERPVCETCLAPDTCPDPSVRELRLGLGARLRVWPRQGDEIMEPRWR